MGFGLVIAFIELLQIVTTSNYIAIANSHTLLQHVLSLLSLLSFHQSLPGDGPQHCPQLPCSRSYRLATVPQLTHCSDCPNYNISTWTAQKIPFLCWVCICLDAHVIATQPLPRNDRCLQSHYLTTANV
jgi:hypothetical protein